MEISAFQTMLKQQEQHWWFKGRRKVISFLLDQTPINKSSELLEIGCGPGGNFELLKSFCKVSAVEMNEFAMNEAKKHSNILVENGYLPDNLPFENKLFDIICLFDVLEHVEHDKEALEAIHNRLKIGGFLIITVPAIPQLYGTHDQEHHHYRRYNNLELRKLLTTTNFTVEEMYYFNSLLLPLAILSRVLQKLLPKSILKGTESPPPLVNKILYKIFSSEVRLFKYFKFPIGLSMGYIVKK